MTSFYVSKMDVAKRELEYSIRLFFLLGDPIVIHLVSSSAQEILKDICNRENTTSYLDEILVFIKEDKKKEVITVKPPICEDNVLGNVVGCK